MLDFFSIFTKGGLVLWYFQAECLKINLQEAINEFIRYSIIDVRILNITFAVFHPEFRKIRVSFITIK